MTTQELKQQIDKVLGNSIRCLLPSYWWKRLFTSLADRVDEVEQSTSQLIDSKVEEVKMPIVESVDELSKLDLPKGSVAAVKDLVCSFKDLYRLTEEDFDDVISNIKKTSRIERIAVKPYVRVPEDFSSCMCALITRSLMSQITFIVESQGDTLQVRYFETTNSEAGMIKLHNADGSINKEAEEQLNSILKEREYRFVGNPNGPTTDEEYEVLDSIFTIWEASDLYIKGASWERFAKESDLEGIEGGNSIIVLDNGTTQKNADAFKKILHAYENDLGVLVLYKEDAVGAFVKQFYTTRRISYANDKIYLNLTKDNDSSDKIYQYKLTADGKLSYNSSWNETTIDEALSDTSTNAVQNKVVTNAINAKADKTYVDEKTYNNSYAIVLASNGFHMNRYGKDGSSLGKVYIKPNVPTRVYATTFAPNGSTGRIKSIKLSHLDTQGATDMGFMFGSSDVWQNVEELDLSYLDTSSVTVMDNFAQLPKVTKLDVTSFDTSNVVNMSCMFRFCENLTDIDVSNFDTSKVLYFDSMFGQCKSLKSLDLSNFNTSSATTMSQMFFNCRDLEYLNLSSFDTSNIENLRGINGIFFGCGSIKTLILGENFFRVAAPIEGDGLQYMNSADFSGLIQWTDESVVTSLVTNSYDRIANGLPEINLSLSSQTMAILTDEHKAIIAAKGYTLQ